MGVLIYLLPIAVLMGLAGLLAFFWSVRAGQFDDMEGPAWRILDDDDERQDPTAAAPTSPSAEDTSPSRHTEDMTHGR